MAALFLHSPCLHASYFPIQKTATSHIESTNIQQNRTTTPIYISWSFPPRGRIKINTDGSFMPYSGLAAFGGVVRDDKGRWLGGFCGRLRSKATSSLTAELWGIHGGLTVAELYNLKNVIIETDSNNALMLLTVEYNLDKDDPDQAVIEECRSLISKLHISMIHTLREGNKCADHLAMLGRNQDQELVIFPCPPDHYTHQLLLNDMSHVSYPRYPKAYNQTRN